LQTMKHDNTIQLRKFSVNFKTIAKKQKGQINKTQRK